jgi:hypothetical protein
VDPAQSFLCALAVARRRARLLAAVESLPLGASAAAAAAATALFLGLPVSLASALALATPLVAFALAPVGARALDGTLALADRLPSAESVARRGPRSGVERLLLRDATGSLLEFPRLRPRRPGGWLRVLAIAAASLLASSTATVPGPAGFFPSMDGAKGPAIAEPRAPVHDPPERVSSDGPGTLSDQAAPGRETAESALPAGNAGVDGARAAGGSGPLPSGAGPGSAGSRAEEKPGPGERVPKPVAIEPPEGPRRAREAFVLEFYDEAAGARRIPLREAVPRARERAWAAFRRSLGSSEETAFAGRYFERLPP